MVYPLPAGLQPPPNALPVPLTMLGNPNFVPHHQGPSIAVNSPQSLFTPDLSGSPLMLPPMNQHSFPLQNTLHPTESVQSMGLNLSMPDALSVSELTNFQIQGFYSHLKFIDNQIANNKHQIDEAYMAHQRSEILAAISNLEAMLQAQLLYEGKVPNVHQNSESNVPSNSHGNGGHHSNNGQLASEHSSADAPSPLDDQTINPCQGIFCKPKVVPVTLSAPKEPTKLAGKAEKSKTTERSLNKKPVTQSEPSAKSKLTAAAAKAPPFQPRAQTARASSNITKNSSSDVETLTIQTHLPVGSQALYPLSWGQSSNVTDATSAGYASVLRGRSMNETSIHSRESSSPITFDQPQSFHGYSGAMAASSMTPIIAPQAVPYLIGVLPRGVDATEAKGTDLLYSRPLTEEEIRARHLYWGRAPRAIQSGLPKFDGKDFYPPSPVKEKHPTRYGLDTARGEFKEEFLGVNESFQSSTNGYMPRPPAHQRFGPQNDPATSRNMFLGNGFKSLSVASDTHGFEAAQFPASPVVYQGIEQPGHGAATIDGHGDLSDPQTEDFSHLFLERGVPGYKSPSPPPHTDSKVLNGGDPVPMTPTNCKQGEAKEIEDDDTETLDSWGAPANYTLRFVEGSELIAPTESDQDEASSDSSTVEINLTRVQGDFPDHASTLGTSERVKDINR